MPTPISEKKIFVLDTNVLLHDHTCIYNFDEHDVVLPIVVLEELDKFKRGNDSINAQAREFIRKLDELSGEQLFSNGVAFSQNGGKGRLFVEIGDPHSDLVGQAFSLQKPDNRILAVADQLRERHADREIIVISKDINLRLKAKSLGIKAQDYQTDKISNIENLKKSSRIHEGIDPKLISSLYEKPYSIQGESLTELEKLPSDRYFIFKSGSSSALSYYNATTDEFERVRKKNVYGIDPRNAEQTFTVDALTRPDIELVAVTGKAGTGKTLLALASALEQRKTFRQIFLARPIVPLGNRDIGFLPGDVKSKLDPYMQPLFDNLNVIRHRFPTNHRDHTRINEMLEQEKLFIAPLAYIRGRSLNQIFFIVDEAQNLTPHEVKTIITRAGEGTKIVFTGDVYQIDTPYLDKESNGLTFLIDRMKNESIFCNIDLIKGERSQLAELASNLL